MDPTGSRSAGWWMLRFPRLPCTPPTPTPATASRPRSWAPNPPKHTPSGTGGVRGDRHGEGGDVPWARRDPAVRAILEATGDPAGGRDRGPRLQVARGPVRSG